MTYTYQGKPVKQEIVDALGTATVKVLPPGLVVSASLAGWGVQEWMYGATVIYVVVQTAYLLWKWINEWRDKRNRPK